MPDPGILNAFIVAINIPSNGPILYQSIHFDIHPIDIHPIAEKPANSKNNPKQND